ncbi:MAG: HlyD family efflux transporter periplasmic adaptor subunit [Pseudomonadales bacterium]|jgi:HlyD family secretion protein|nr:HlyD family efflux transporter periplasmic adaptor subunit [Pseudomonadales bacterium]
MSPTTRRILFWSLPAAALLFGLAVAFRPQAVPVDLAPVERAPMRVTIDEKAETRVKDSFVVSAPIPGRVLRATLEAGDAVIAGETIVASIEPTDPALLDPRAQAEADAALEAARSALALAEAEVEQADAELDFATSELARMRALLERGATSEQAVDQAERAFRTRRAARLTAEAALDVRRHEFDVARARLITAVDTRGLASPCACADLTAPITGRVLKLFQESEAPVQSGTPLLEIGNPAELEIVAELLSEDAVRVAPGQRVIVDRWGGEGTLEGRVRRVEPYGFTKVSALGIEEQRVNVVIDLTGPPERHAALGHGFRVQVRIVVWETDSALQAPLTALFRQGEDWALFAEADGRARLRSVAVGERNGLTAELRAGVTAGERVVLHPSDRIEEGTRIRARDGT